MSQRMNNDPTVGDVFRTTDTFHTANDFNGGQLGLRGDVLEAFGRREVVEVLDLTAFVAEQRERLATGGVAALLTPRERVYRPADPAVAARLRLDEWQC